MSGMDTGKDTGNGVGNGRAHFDRRNALYDRGYVGALPATELRVFLAFDRHANRDGVAWPSPEKIARKLGIGVRNVQRAIASLVRRGMLTGGASGSGRGHIAKRTLIVPENPAQRAAFSPRQNPAQRDNKTRRTKTGKPGAIAQENPAQCATRRVNELPNELPTTTTQRAGDAGRGGRGGFLLKMIGKKAAEEAIARHGEEHCRRTLELVDLMQDNGDAKLPGRLLASLLKMEVEAVDFTPLEEHEEAEESRRQWELKVEADKRLEEESNRRLAEAKAIIKAVPKEQVPAWKRMMEIKFPGNSFSDDGLLSLAKLIQATPDIDIALAEAEAELERTRTRNAGYAHA